MQDNEPTLAAMRKLRAWRFIIIIFFQCYVCPGDKRALHTNEDCWKHNFNGAQTCTRQLVLDQHNKSQSHHGLLKLHLVSKNLRKRRTKSLSGWKRNACYGNACYATSKLSFNPRTALPFVETDDRKRFPCLYVVWNNKPGPSFLEFNWCKGKR